MDPRLTRIQEADGDNPGTTADAQMAVICDNLFAGYLRNPSKTDAMLRRDGLTATAARLSELFGPNWGQRFDASV